MLIWFVVFLHIPKNDKKHWWQQKKKEKDGLNSDCICALHMLIIIDKILSFFIGRRDLITFWTIFVQYFLLIFINNIISVDKPGLICLNVAHITPHLAKTTNCSIN